jgi:DNA-binding SARP family transcriptional activator
VDLLGGLRVRRAGGSEIRVASRKAQAVLVCLALRPGAAYSRDLLSSLLWEDSDPELARSSLRQALAALRRSLPEELAHALQGDAQTVALDAALVASDVSRFRALLRDGSPNALAEVAERHVAPLLEGFDARSAAFEQWLDERRRELRREQLQALERLAVQSRSIGDATQTLLALERLTALEPTNERAQRELIDLLASLGRYTDALRQYRVCRDVLRRDLDVAPEPATEALQREVLRRRRAAQPEPGIAIDRTTLRSRGRAWS